MKRELSQQFGDCIVEYYRSGVTTFVRIIASDDSIRVYEVFEKDFIINSPLKYIQGRMEDMGFIKEASAETDAVILLNNLGRFIEDPETTPENREKFEGLKEDLDCYYWWTSDIIPHLEVYGNRLYCVGKNKYARGGNGYYLDFEDTVIEDTPIVFVEY